ncbi:MAG: ABC transporter ATP-binding protein [Gemmataceae bacterium]
MARDDKKPADSAFTKAAGYLAYSGQARTTAYVSAAASALVVVGLLGLLWLFVDYMVWRGHVPAYAELAYAEKQRVLGRWNAAAPEARAAWLARAGFTPAEQKELASAPGDGLKPRQKERVWEEMVQDILLHRLGAEAYDEVFEPEQDSPSGYAMRRDDHGMISLVVRSEMRRLPTAVPWLASWNRWTWNLGRSEVSLFPPYLAGLALATVILGLAGVMLVIVNREAAARAATEASSRLRRAVYHQTFRLGTLAVRALGPTEAVTLLTRHCESLHDALYATLSSLAREPVLIGLLVALAFWIDPLLSLAFVLVVVIVYAVGVQLLARFRRQSKAATNIAAERLTIIRESLMLMRLVKCYLMEPFNQTRIERQLARYGQAQRLRHRAEAVVMPLLVLLAGACLLALVYVGALMVLYGGLPVAGAVTLAATCLCLYRPLDRYLEARRLLKRGRDSADQVFAFLERKGDVGQVVGAEFLQPMTKQLEFAGVSLREPGTGRMLLEDVSLTIPSGQRIGLIGPDDLEKQALVYLIPRLLDPTAGEIRIDAHNLRWVTLDSLRAQIGIVMMHNLVFHDTVRNNIGCGDHAYTLPQIIEAAKMAHAHHFIQKLPEGYETPLGELGHSLSLSEQYRIALARAILRDPAVLIIEEPEAELDEETKDLLDDTMARVLPGRTAIFLPHRISTLKACNKIYVLTKGRIVAAGTHKDLIVGNKLYRHLHYLEFNEMDER